MGPEPRHAPFHPVTNLRHCTAAGLGTTSMQRPWQRAAQLFAATGMVSANTLGLMYTPQDGRFGCMDCLELPDQP